MWSLRLDRNTLTTSAVSISEFITNVPPKRISSLPLNVNVVLVSCRTVSAILITNPPLHVLHGVKPLLNTNGICTLWYYAVSVIFFRQHNGGIKRIGEVSL